MAGVAGHAAADAEEAFCALGSIAEAFITGAAAAGNTRLGPELAELNTLAAAHPRGAARGFPHSSIVNLWASSPNQATSCRKIR